MTSINYLYNQTLKSNLVFILYDRSNLRATRQIAMNLVNSYIPTSTPLLHPMAESLPFLLHHHLPVSSHPNLSLISYDFYPWLFSVLNEFTLTRCDDPAKLVLTLQAIPLNKRGSFNTITNWTSFKTRLIEEFESIESLAEMSIKFFTSSPL